MNSENGSERLQQIIDESRNIVFFGGAGVSTESGIPDFRSTDGLYRQTWTYPPETILSRSFFDAHPAEFYRFYRAKMIVPDAKPNAAHFKLAELEAAGKLGAVITQNIDGLHQAAGSKTVYELHGSVLRNYCMKCGAFYPVRAILDAAPGADIVRGDADLSPRANAAYGDAELPRHTANAYGDDSLLNPPAGNRVNGDGIPRCTHCGGIIKPDVVLYEEGLDGGTVDAAVRAISCADTLIIGGTSLVVYPAASLIDYFHGRRLVLINKSATAADGRADLCITDRIGAVLDAVHV
ncbi:NAD-dependent deacylase [Treponema brennaborense]|uniref:NAD-dependent protein deacetylase n=1 Tax=Treponema brennaborense (strain DSM 12168 / CIP 105900 / DD5/3) TaxID=906968 RepID=F4LPJ4_TREBD|nr:NAD-dependent deacylase [Treponema brennaborense]AEE16005.1 NAD-dependent deacetylase [Treponema brennaborense DSM 12168]